MRIDFHAHVGPELKGNHLRELSEAPPYSPKVEKYIDAMDKAGVDKGVTLGGLDLDYEYQANIQKKYPDRIISFAWINPRDKNCAEIFRHCVEDIELKGLKLHGFWHQVSYSQANLLDPLVKICDKYKLPVILHTEGGNAFTSPLHAEELAKRWPNVNFIMSHGGAWYCAREALLVTKRTSNLYIDTAVAESSWITKWAKDIGADRVAMGSDWPWNHLDAVVNTNEISIPDPKDREWVMSKTALKLLGLSK